MKKWFFMLICMVAFVLPQNVWAQTVPSESSVNVSGGVLTVNSANAGYLSSVTKTVDMKACTSIVLVGKFNEADLQSIQSTSTDFRATSVDMSEAQFVTSVGGGTGSSVTGYVLYNNSTTTPSGAPAQNTYHAICGGYLYQSVQGNKWNPVNAPEGGTTKVLANTATVSPSDNLGEYAKIPTGSFKYLQMSSASWSGPTQAVPENPIDLSSNIENRTDWEDYLDEILSSYQDNQSIKLLYRFTWDTSKGVWVRATKEIYDQAEANGGAYGTGISVSDLAKLLNEEDANNPGRVSAFPVIVYYTKNGTAPMWINETETQPSTYVEASFDYAYRNNNLDTNTYPNGTWVKMTDYNYYQLQNNGDFYWNQVSYEDGAVKDANGTDIFANEGEMNSYSPTYAGRYAIVKNGCKEYAYDSSTSAWVDGTVTLTETPNYSQMKFSYWSETLLTAKTSKYADSNINSDIFQNCKNITRIEFLGGHVKGLQSRPKGQYANFTLYVGKNVTEVEDGALNQSSALTVLEFDRTYSSEERNSGNYPKELIIGNSAFNDCYYVSDIVIPNRCVSIGNTAFKNVGNGEDKGIAFTSISNQELNLTFERRNAADTDQGDVGINCDFPLQIGTSAFHDCWYLKDLSLPIRLETMGNDCFKNTKSLQKLEMREETQAPYTPPTNHNLLRTIPTGAFEASAIAELKVPKCVTTIEAGAFGSTTNLQKVTFQDNDENPKKSLTIKKWAFTGGQEEGRPQLDVYVMINPIYDAFLNPNPGRMVLCEYNAFNFTQTVGQTSETRGSAYLHFPEEAWDYYQGNWKRGLAFQQSNLNAFKDGYTGQHGQIAETCVGKGDENSFSEATGKYTKKNSADVDARLVAPANGWQEFARTSTAIDIEIPVGSFLRSYSTKKPMAIPLYASGSHTGKPMFKIYRISAFDNSTTNKVTATEVAEHTGSGSDLSVVNDLYIPKNSGFLMKGEGDGGYLLYMKELEEDVTTAKTYPFTAEGDNANLLYPTCLDEQFVRPTSWPAKALTPTLVNDGAAVVLYPTIPHPYSPTKAPLQFRLFGLTPVEGHQGQFDRISAATVVSRDKAYLRLTPGQFDQKAEGQFGGGDSGLGENAGAAPIMLSFMDPDGNTTDVRMMNPETMTIMEDCYYTLQGMKISGRPTQKGIYIHNGKKVIIN